jgi:oxygen-independent coproporphyrinogen-3 oxidase
MAPLGIYISIPFCRSKCSYCNFASDVVSRAVFERYTGKVCAEIRDAEETANQIGGIFENAIDSIYLGGGTPTLLQADQLSRIFMAVRDRFASTPGMEVTVECAPGAITAEALEILTQCGVNRISLGVQSFVDAEARSVGRLHNRAVVLSDIDRLRAAGISNFNIDLIAGLPYQTKDSWRYSLDEAVQTGAPHISVYMLEIDDESRLGRELMAGGNHYHAHHVPGDDLIADLYGMACEALNEAGRSQYEISNFAIPGGESRHNLKYWTRQPYLGFGVDAHSFLPRPGDSQVDGMYGAIRYSNPDSLDAYLAGAPLNLIPVSHVAAREECFFLGLRLNQGIDLKAFGQRNDVDVKLNSTISELCEMGLLDYDQNVEVIRLTPRGRLLSNEVFARFVE